MWMIQLILVGMGGTNLLKMTFACFHVMMVAVNPGFLQSHRPLQIQTAEGSAKLNLRLFVKTAINIQYVFKLRIGQTLRAGHQTVPLHPLPVQSFCVFHNFIGIQLAYSDRGNAAVIVRGLRAESAVSGTTADLCGINSAHADLIVEITLGQFFGRFHQSFERSQLRIHQKICFFHCQFFSIQHLIQQLYRPVARVMFQVFHIHCFVQWPISSRSSTCSRMSRVRRESPATTQKTIFTMSSGIKGNTASVKAP